MPQAYISIGSNVNAEDNIIAAIRALKKCYGDLTLSTVYKNRAVGFDGDDFLNLVVGLETAQSITALVENLHRIEAAQGRTRNTEKKFSPRTLDMDLLLYGNEAFHAAGISIPRDEITRYAFVLQPLFEITPNYYHPTENCTIAQLWDNFDKKDLTMQPVELAMPLSTV